jgi:nucleoside-diphosphate-sugar epimerase
MLEANETYKDAFNATERLGVVLVTGGAGWLGTHLVAQLACFGTKAGFGGDTVEHIHVCDVAKGSVLDDIPLGARGRITFHELDLRNSSAVRKLIMDIQPRVVFHLASVVDVRPFRDEAVFDINVSGTVNLVVAASACHACEAFVYCSTLDVVYVGKPMDRVHEGLPYTDSSQFPRWVPNSSYPISKARAEQVVLGADSSGTAAPATGLRTCALRPGHLFGERDALLDMFANLPVSAAGPPHTLMTMQYIGNAAAMHVLAARKLLAERRQQKRGGGKSGGGGGGGGCSNDSVPPLSFSVQQKEALSGRAVNMGDFETNFTQFYGRILQPSPHTVPGHKPPYLAPLPVVLLFIIGLCLDLIDFTLILLAQALTPVCIAFGLVSRSSCLGWRLPRHPALCLASTTALESSMHHSTNRTLGERVFTHTSLVGVADDAFFLSRNNSLNDSSTERPPSAPALAALKESGGVGLVGREESTRRTRTWIEARLSGQDGAAKPTGYSFKG